MIQLELLTHLITIALGLVIGSFLNVVVVRLPRELSVVRPRSRCPKCETPLRWHDNIPVVSYFLLLGRCRKCREPISIRYPVIELITALVFLAAKIRFGWGAALFVRDFPFLAILIAVTFIDLEHRIIPDELSLGGLALGMLSSFLDPRIGWSGALAGAALGFGLFYGLAWAYEKFAKRPGLGGGDVKLLAMLGAFVGPMGVLAAIFVSSVFGSVVGIAWGLILKSRGGPGSEGSLLTVAIPYGPFLVVGGLYYYFLGHLLWFQSMIPI